MTSLLKHSIAYGDERIEFELRFVRAATTRRIAISVLPDGTVQVDVPNGVPEPEVRRVVSERARWIWRHLENHRKRMMHVLKREYVSGESHFYLGRRYMLKVSDIHDGAPEDVKLRGAYLRVRTASREKEVVRRHLDAWYRARAREVFQRRLDELAAGIPWLAGAPAFRMIAMRTQWGSCSPVGNLSLNPNLVKAPRACIDYVLLHELCHLRVRNHGKDYYRLLQGLLPDWERRKFALDQMAERLLNC